MHREHYLPKSIFSTLSKPSSYAVRLLAGLVVYLFTLSASYADCGCDYTVPAGQHLIDGRTLGIRPGSVICLKSGTNYKNLKFTNLNGTASKPIIIKNCGGKVTINTSATFAIKTNASRHFRITGSGDRRYEHGIELRGASSLGLTLDLLSTDFEVDHLEIHRVGFAGIMAKTDPKCGKPYNRGQFTMRHVKIHDNYIHDTGGEGIYLGNSFYAKGRKSSCGTLMPHEVHNAKIYNNTIKHTGWDGIQIGSATRGCEVYNNTVENYGTKGNNTHGNGIQLGEGTGGKCYNNTIKNGKHSGIIALGMGDNLIFNNLIINPGEFGAFIDSRPPASSGDGFKFVNNTVINPRQNGVRIYAKQSNLRNKVKNNILVGGSEAVRLLHSGITNTQVANNFETRDINKVGFVNPGGGDYHLKGSSACINEGENLYSKGVTFGKDRKSRPRSGAFEQGAYTYGGSSSSPANKAPSVSAGSDRTVSLPTNSLTIKAKAFDSDGSVTSYHWQKESGSSSIKLSNTDRASVSIEGLKEGEYQLKVTVKDNKGAGASDYVKITVKPKSKEKSLPPPSPAPSGDKGLNYSYYEGGWSRLPNFDRMKPKKSGTVANFDLGPRKRNDNFAFRFKGYINISKAGTYRFYTTSDDGSKLSIKGKTIVNNDGLHAPQERSGSVYLSKGKHPIQVTFFERTVGEVLEVRYSGPGIGKQRIPSSVLSRKGSGDSPTIASSGAKASAGSDKTTSASRAILRGKGIGPNPFRKYQWAKVSGPGVSMKNQNTANVELSNLRSGTYVFRFTATDSQGNTGSDEMTLRINGNARTTTAARNKLQEETASSKADYQVDAYPNPVQDRLRIAIQGAQDENLTLQVVDAIGRVMFEQETLVNQVSENLTLDVNQYISTPGLFYLIVTRASGAQSTVRLLKE